MTFKARDQVLEADPRFASLAIIDEDGARLMDITDHHRAIGMVMRAMRSSDPNISSWMAPNS
jgi:hypothetical protein